MHISGSTHRHITEPTQCNITVSTHHQSSHYICIDTSSDYRIEQSSPYRTVTSPYRHTVTSPYRHTVTSQYRHTVTSQYRHRHRITGHASLDCHIKKSIHRRIPASSHQSINTANKSSHHNIDAYGLVAPSHHLSCDYSDVEPTRRQFHLQHFHLTSSVLSQ